MIREEIVLIRRVSEIIIAYCPIATRSAVTLFLFTSEIIVDHSIWDSLEQTYRLVYRNSTNYENVQQGRVTGASILFPFFHGGFRKTLYSFSCCVNATVSTLVADTNAYLHRILYTVAYGGRIS